MSCKGKTEGTRRRMNTSVSQCSAIRIKAGSEQNNPNRIAAHLHLVGDVLRGTPLGLRHGCVAGDGFDGFGLSSCAIFNYVRVGRYLFWWLLYRIQGIQISDSSNPPGLDPLEWHVLSCRPTVWRAAAGRCGFGACVSWLIWLT